MKTFLAAIFLFASASSFACNREALFIGTVKNLKATEDGYSFQVRLGNYFSASSVCPLWETELESAVIFEKGTPSFQNGDAVSGVMVQDEVTGLFHIE